MIERFFQQPTWPVAIATLAAVIVTAVLQFLLYRRSRLFAEEMQARANAIAQRNAETAASLAELKRIELGGITTAKLTDHAERRAARLHDEFAELLALLDAGTVTTSTLPSEKADRILSLCRSISLSLSPRGDFAETLNEQLGHVRQAVSKGLQSVTDWPGLIEALRYNAWKIVDAERDRIPESLLAGTMIERRELEPVRWQFR